MKRALSIVLSVCLLCSLLCVANVLQIQAAEAPTPTQQEITLKDNLNYDDSSYIDESTTEGVTTQVDVWSGSTENGTSYQIDAGEQLVYKIKIPTNVNLSTFDFVTASNGGVNVELSVNGKASWISLEKTVYDSFTASFGISKDEAAPVMPVDGMIYARVTGEGARMWVFKYRYYTFGEEYGVLAEGATEGSMEVELKVPEASEISRLVSDGGTSYRNPFGNGQMREIAAGSNAEVIYYFDLPDTATSYKFLSYYADDMRLWVSKDNASWTPLNNGGKVGLGAYEFAVDDSILEDNDSKAFWVKITSAEGLLYMNLVLRYTYGQVEDVTPAPDVVIQQPSRMEAILLNHSLNMKDNAYVDSVSGEGVGNLSNYWNPEDTDTNNHIGRGLVGEEWLIYKLQVPTNTNLQTYQFNSCGTTNGAMAVSTDKENWIDLEKVAEGTFFGEHLSYGFARGEAPAMPADGTIYLKMRSTDGGKYYWQGLFMYFYGYGEEPSQEVTEGELNGESEIKTNTFGEMSRLVDAGGTTCRDPFGGGQMREILAGSGAEVIYYIDLPDGAASYTFHSWYVDDMRLWVSRDKSTWIPLNEGGKVGLGAYDFAGNASILENNDNKAFYVKVTSEEGLLYTNLVLRYIYGKPDEAPEDEEQGTPGETIISITPGSLAELDYYDGTANLNGSCRVAEAKNYVEYVFDIPSEATVATLTYSIRGDYKVLVSTDGADYATIRQSISRDFSWTTAAEDVVETLQLSRFLVGEGEKSLYVRFEDTTREDLCGLWLSNTTLTYYTDGREATEEQLAKEDVIVLPEVGSTITRMDCFAPNTSFESNYEVSNSTTPDNFFSNPCRRLYEGNSVVYKFTYDATATDISLWVQTLGANMFEISKDGETWEIVCEEKYSDIRNLEFDANHLMEGNEDRTVYIRTSYNGASGDSSLLLWAGLMSTFVYDGTNIDISQNGPVRPTDQFTAEDVYSGLSIVVPVDAVYEQVLSVEVGGETVEGGAIYKEILDALDPAYINNVIYSTFLCDQELNAVVLKAPATVTIVVPEALNAADVDVYMYDTETFTLTKLEATVGEGTLTFETTVMDHLILASKATDDENESSDAEEESSKNEDTSSGEKDESSNVDDEVSDSESKNEEFVDTGVENWAVAAVLMMVLAVAMLIASKKRSVGAR